MFDFAWAAITPILALMLRDLHLPVLNSQFAIYWGVSLACAVITFSAFGLSNGITRFFSVSDALDVVKAVLCAGVITVIALFSINRLDGIPRSIPLIHMMLLAGGLLAVRALARMWWTERVLRQQPQILAEQVIVIGSNRLASLFMKFLDAYAPGNHRVIAVLDDAPGMIGRSLEGVRIAGTTQQLAAMIDEFEEHGVSINRVLIGGEETDISEESLGYICAVCSERKIKLDFIPRLIGLTSVQPVRATTVSVAPISPLPAYFGYKRYFDVVAALVLIFVFSPIMIVATVLALLDVGSPAIFWQQRIGLRGRRFQLHKFRTMRSPFDWEGNAVTDDKRSTRVGWLLRKTRLDELPQLFSVLVGDMSIVGPRPLLPRDQPDDPTMRLTVRPGITGWAQVNGSTWLNPKEKNELDEWYVRHASLWLDIKIICITVAVFFGLERRPASKSVPISPEPDPQSIYVRR